MNTIPPAPQLPPPGTNPISGWLGKVLTVLLGSVLVILGVMFSLVALAVVAVGGMLFAGWFWWKTRALRQRMQQPPEAAAAEARDSRPQDARPRERIIEGEFTRETGAPEGSPPERRE